MGAHMTGKDGVMYGRNVRIGASAEIGVNTTIRSEARIGQGASIGGFGFIGRGVTIPGLVRRRHTYHDEIRDNAVIGHGVTLPAEYQLGNDAVIPNSNCITSVGRLGSTQRMVTVYGSDEGPLYGVGCQFGIAEDVFHARVTSSTETHSDSAADYARYWSVLTAAGLMVQRAYELAHTQVEDLRAEARVALTERASQR